MLAAAKAGCRKEGSCSAVFQFRQNRSKLWFEPNLVTCAYRQGSDLMTTKELEKHFIS